MKISEPTIRGSILLNTHPYGCQELVKEQIQYVKSNASFEGPKKVLVLGCSSGYGLASRIAVAFGSKADTIGVSFETGVSAKRIGTAGWYNNIFFKQQAEKDGLIAQNFIGDAFSYDMKKQVIDYIKKDFGGKIDLVIYSLASGKRIDPDTQETYISAIRSTLGNLKASTINLEKQTLEEGEMIEASAEDIRNTIKVMGGEDWRLWIQALDEADVLADGFKSFAETYLGSQLTHKIYKEGTLGAAKRHLEKTATELQATIGTKYHGEIFVCSSKAIVTKASVYIPLFSLYAAALFKVMKKQKTHENAIEHKYRFLKEMVYNNKREIDTEGRFRPDSWELDLATQKEVKRIMDKVTPDNFKELTDFEGIYLDFLKLNGFGFKNINYELEIDVDQLKQFIP